LASVKASQKPVGPDSNNRLTYEHAGVKFRNATLRCLVAEAYGLQLNQVLGPSWLDQREYDIEAKADRPATKEQLRVMLRTLLTERFKLMQHRETKDLRAYELVIDKAGLKIHAIEDGEAPGTTAGHRFRGDFRRLADLLAVQLTIHVSDDDAAQIWTDTVGFPAARLQRLDEENFWLHKFRATLATRCLWAGVDLRTVQQWHGVPDAAIANPGFRRSLPG
jgi:uncharacterized protein (TIGR03435 family)